MTVCDTSRLTGDGGLRSGRVSILTCACARSGQSTTSTPTASTVLNRQPVWSGMAGRYCARCSTSTTNIITSTSSSNSCAVFSNSRSSNNNNIGGSITLPSRSSNSSNTLPSSSNNCNNISNNSINNSITLSSSNSSNSILTQPLCVGVVLLLLVLYSWAATPVQGQSAAVQQTAGGCHMDQCWDLYTTARHTLGLARTSPAHTHLPAAPAPLHPDGGGDDLDKQAHPRRGGGDDDGGGGGGSDFGQQAQCVTLRTYLSCLLALRGCHGDIRFHSERNWVKSHLRHHSCSVQGPLLNTSHPSFSQRQLPPPGRQVPTQCQFKGDRIFRHCALFGDPHLRTFSGEFHTCRVEGAWPLVSNDYLLVQVTNQHVLNGVKVATAITKVTVLVKSHGPCSPDHYVTYEAHSGHLPPTLQDGRRRAGRHGSLQVVEVEAGRHVEIVVHPIATTVIIRLVDRFLTLAISMPLEVLASETRSPSLQLCSGGCPPSQRVDPSHVMARGANSLRGEHSMRVGEAEAVCRQSGLVGDYFQACVFDLVLTADTSFVSAALRALADVVRLDPAFSLPTHAQTQPSFLPERDATGPAPASHAARPGGWWAVVGLGVVLTSWYSGIRERG